MSQSYREKCSSRRQGKMPPLLLSSSPPRQVGRSMPYDVTRQHVAVVSEGYYRREAWHKADAFVYVPPFVTRQRRRRYSRCRPLPRRRTQPPFRTRPLANRGDMRRLKYDILLHISLFSLSTEG